jgi:hypothetical protein
MPRYINPVPQYHDSQGDILVEGFLLFEESGTNTKKDIFHDVDLTIAATNPVKLDGAGRTPSLFTEGLYKVTAFKDDGLGQPGEQQWSRDPVGDDADGFGSTWGQTSTYALEDVVQGSDGEYYISIISANKGNNPTTTPTAWSRINLIVDWNTNETYAQFDVAKGSDGSLYYSVIGSNVGNDPVGDGGVNWDITVPDGGVTTAKLQDGSVNADKIDGSDASAIAAKLGTITEVITTVITATDAAWTPNANAVGLKFEGVGGGGGSGGTDGQGAGTAAVSQAGSGAGTCEATVWGADVEASYNITIGVAGPAGAAGNNAGGNGGDTTIVSTNVNFTAGGGVGGNGDLGTSGLSVAAGVPGGTATGGDINTPGGATDGTVVANGDPMGAAKGGDSLHGFGGVGALSGFGSPGTGFGAGGGSTGSFDTLTDRAGAAGSQGAVIVTQYIAG